MKNKTDVNLEKRAIELDSSEDLFNRFPTEINFIDLDKKSSIAMTTRLLYQDETRYTTTPNSYYTKFEDLSELIQNCVGGVDYCREFNIENEDIIEDIRWAIKNGHQPYIVRHYTRILSYMKALLNFKGYIEVELDPDYTPTNMNALKPVRKMFKLDCYLDNEKLLFVLGTKYFDLIKIPVSPLDRMSSFKYNSTTSVVYALDRKYLYLILQKYLINYLQTVDKINQEAFESINNMIDNNILLIPRIKNNVMKNWI